MSEADFKGGDRFIGKLEHYFQQAQALGWLGPKSVVVLPEFVGTWLVVADEWDSVYEQGSVNSAMYWLILRNLIGFIRALPGSPGPDRTRSAIFGVKGERMAEIFDQTFSALARKFQVTVVSGSIVLPGPEVRDGHLRAKKGEPLYNVALVYRPDGRAESRLVYKAYPISEERTFLLPRPVEELPVFDTPAGKLGVLICADSWFPRSYEVLRSKKVDLIAVTSWLGIEGGMSQTWKGYDGGPAPADVDPSDVGRLTEGQAWEKYALPGRFEASGAKAGVTVFLRGQLWGMGSAGHPLIGGMKAPRGKIEKIDLRENWVRIVVGSG